MTRAFEHGPEVEGAPVLNHECYTVKANATALLLND